MTGQASSQLRQVVHAKISSSVMTSPIILTAFISATAASRSIRANLFGPWSPKANAGTQGDFPVTAAPLSFKWSRSLIIISIGDKIFPVVAAGQTLVQRPHSTQE